MPLKNGWLEDFLLSYWVSAYFQGRLLLVSGRVESNKTSAQKQIQRLFQHTELEHTPSNLYQKAKEGFLS